MNNYKKLIGIALFAIFVGTLPLFAEKPLKEYKPNNEDKAMQIAPVWFDSLMKGNTAVTMAVSDIPFSWDGKEAIESMSKLEEFFELVVNEKGKRDFGITDVKIATGLSENEMSEVPKDCIVVLVIIGNEDIALFVKPGVVFKVVGFRD